MEHKTNCLVCGADLVYTDIAKPRECAYCQRMYDSNVACTLAHYVCDRCHSLPAFDLIREFCTNNQSIDPLEMALVLMRHPAVKMHGPEHHFLIPAVLLSAYYNLKDDPEQKARKISEAEKRSKNILAGSADSTATAVLPLEQVSFSASLLTATLSPPIPGDSPTG